MLDGDRSNAFSLRTAGRLVEDRTEGFGSLYHASYGVVRGYLRRRLAPHEVQDALAEVYLVPGVVSGMSLKATRASSGSSAWLATWSRPAAEENGVGAGSSRG
jgi:hypothetical protein